MLQLERRTAFRLPLDLSMGRQATFYPIGILGRVSRQYDGAVFNISVDGISARVGAKVKKRQKFWILLNMPGPIKGLRLMARAMWIEKEGRDTGVGFEFIKPPAEALYHIGRMANDYKACEGAIAFAMANTCKRTCTYWDLCRKPVKLVA